MALRNVYASAEDLANEVARLCSLSSQAEVARQAKVRPPLISNVVAGKINPCGRLLKWLGYERVVTYRRLD